MLFTEEELEELEECAFRTYLKSCNLGYSESEKHIKMLAEITWNVSATRLWISQGYRLLKHHKKLLRQMSEGRYRTAFGVITIRG